MRDYKTQKLYTQQGRAANSRQDTTMPYNFNDTFTRHGAQHSDAPCSTKMVRQAQQTMRNKRVKVTLPALPWNNNEEGKR